MISSVEAEAVLACKSPIIEPVISTLPCTFRAADVLVLVVPIPTAPVLSIIIAGILSLLVLFIELSVTIDKPFLAQICNTSSVSDIVVFLRTTIALEGTIFSLSSGVSKTVLSI